MLRTECIDLSNSGRSWAFVGAGASVESGCPNWDDLLKLVVAKLPPTVRREIEQDPVFKGALDQRAFPLCFRRIEQRTTRDALEVYVADEIRKYTHPSDLHKEIASWPFASYITTNYDTLLERALEKLTGESWLSVGNTLEETRKISGDVSNIVWHIHGAIDLPTSKSNFIITDEDYERLYQEGSVVLTQLRGLLSQRRIVFLGFGFRDPEVMRLLRQVGRFCNPARPAYAFLSGVSTPEKAPQRKELLERYNIDVIPYEKEGQSHKQLLELLHIYGSLILRRNLRFGDPERPCPSYHPEATGLLIYNELCMKKGAQVSEDLLGTLLRARIISLLNRKGGGSTQEIVDELVARAKLLKVTPRSFEETSKEVESQIEKLVQSGLVDRDDVGTLKLTSSGISMTASHSAKAELLSEQFAASLTESRKIE